MKAYKIFLLLSLLVSNFVSPRQALASTDQVSSLNAPSGDVAAQTQPPTDWYMAGANLQRTSWVSAEVTGNLKPLWYTPIEPYINPRVQVIATGGKLFVSTAKGLYSYNPDNGAQLWVYPTKFPIAASPTVIGSTAYIGVFDRHIHAVNTDNGQGRWISDQAGAGFDTSPLVVNNKVIAGNRDGYMYAFDSATGKTLWKYKTDGPILFSAAYYDGKIYFASSDMRAYALTESGSLVWKSAALPGSGFNSWWPVVYQAPGTDRSKDRIIISGGWNYREDMGPEGNKKFTEMQAAEAFPSAKKVEGAEISYNEIVNYYNSKPYRKTTIVLNPQTGAEMETAPFLYAGTTNGTRFPAMVGSDGRIYQQGTHEYHQWIPGASLMSWKPGESNFVTSDDVGYSYPSDEPMYLSLGGKFAYFGICCDRFATGFNTTNHSSGLSLWGYNLDSKFPGYNLYYQRPNCPGDCYGVNNITTHFGTRNGAYGVHGEGNPPIPYNGKIYLHRGNSLLAFSPTAASVVKNPKSTIVNTASDPVQVLGSSALKNNLAAEVQKMLDAGHLRKPYVNQRKMYCIGSEMEYWQNSSMTIYTLLRALPHLPASMQPNVKQYIQNEYNTYKPYEIWNEGFSGTPREYYSAPPDAQQKLNTAGNQAGTTAFSLYVSWKYAQTFGNAAAVFNNIKDRLPTPPANAELLKNPYKLNEYIAGYWGYLELQKLATGTETASIRTTLNNLIALRTNNFTNQSAYADIWESKDVHSTICNQLNIASNFLYLVPELAEVLRTKNLSQVQSAITEDEFNAPFWFVGFTHNGVGESTLTPLYDVNAVFQAKALILRTPASELEKYLDVSAFKVGDLYYILNLTTVLDFSSPGTTPNATPTSALTATSTPGTPTPMVTATADSCGTTNIALNRPTTSSSTEIASFSPNQAVDGLTNTRWSSSYSDPQWVQVDLGSTQSICRVRLTWETAYAQSYEIQVSDDGTTWSTIYSTTTGDGGTDDLTGLTGSGRYVRVTGTTRATTYGYSLWEIEVFAGVSSITPTPATAAPTSAATDTPAAATTPTLASTAAATNTAVVTTATPVVSGPATSIAISNISENSSIAKYDKQEITFSVTTSASNPQLPFDPSAPNGVNGSSGVSVDAVFTSPSGKTWSQPGFYYQIFDDQVKGGAAWFYPTGQAVWKVRFSPNEVGTWQYYIKAQDKTGTTQSATRSFNVTASAHKGFIQASKSDPRYFEYTDGTYFPALGLNATYNEIQWGNPNANQDYLQKAGANGIQVVRTWLSHWSIFGSTWNPWYGSRNDYDGYIPRAGLYTNDITTSPMSTLRMVYADNNSGDWFEACRFIGGHQAPPAVKQNTKYHIKIRYKAQGISGPRDAAYPGFGLVAKVQNPNDGNWHTKCYNGGEPQNGVKVTSYGKDSANWVYLEGEWNSGTRNTLPMFYLALENVNSQTAPQVDIDTVFIGEDLGGGSYGPNIVTKPSMEQLTYYMERNAYAFDKTLELAKQNDVYLKLVVMEKNDILQMELSYDGKRVKSDNNNFYGNYRNMTAVRWYQQAWWRYLQARWGYSPNIFAFEAVNEAEPGNSNHHAQVDEMGKYLHCGVFGVALPATDGQKCNLSHPNAHMVSTSLWHSFDSALFVGNKYPNVDYADIHQYIPKDTDLKHFQDTALSTYDLGMAYGAIPSGSKKPIIRGETGLINQGANTDGSADLSADKQGIWLHKMIWGGINASGLIEHYWYAQSHIFNPVDLRSKYKNYYLFIKDIPLNNGKYVDASATASNAKLRVWGQKDLTNQRAHLWIANTDHIWTNTGTIAPINGSVTLKGLAANTSFNVEWWDTYMGKVSSTQSISTTATGDLVLNVSNLTTDVAVRIAPQGTVPVSTPMTVTTTPGIPTTTATSINTPVGGSTINIGETNILETDISNAANSLLAQQSDLPQPGTIQSLSIYVTTTGGRLRLGIYDASGPNGGPGALKAQTDEFTPVAGWNTRNVITPTQLSAGAYWLAFLPESPTLGLRMTQTGAARGFTYPFGALPGTFSSAPQNGIYHWSFYATLLTNTAATNTPVAGQTLTSTPVDTPTAPTMTPTQATSYTSTPTAINLPSVTPSYTFTPTAVNTRESTPTNVPTATPITLATRTAIPSATVPAASPTTQANAQNLLPVSLKTGKGSTTGTVSALNTLTQSGTTDQPNEYMVFQTPGSSVYNGYLVFQAPANTPTSAKEVSLLVNFKGGNTLQTWVWSVYDWKAQKWVKVGSVSGAQNQWKNLKFNLPMLKQFASSQGEIRIQLRSNNARGDARIDYMVIQITR